MKKLFFILFFIFLFSYAARIDMTLRAQTPSGEVYKDKEGKTYTVYVGARGGKYILKTSKKTGKEYKYYLPKKGKIMGL